jgi:hypothetical protein
MNINLGPTVFPGIVPVSAKKPNSCSTSSAFPKRLFEVLLGWLVL